jgi:hypothetical protein
VGHWKLVVVVGVLLSGCAEHGENVETTRATSAVTDCARDCDGKPIGSQAPTTAVPTPANSVVMSDCTLYAHTLQTRDQVYAPEYPAGIRPVSDEFEYSLLYVWQCGQFVFDSVVADDVRLGLFASQIAPIDGGDHELVFLSRDWYTDNEALFETFEGRGLPMERVESISIRLDLVADQLHDYELATSGPPLYAASGTIYSEYGNDATQADNLYFAMSDGLRNVTLVRKGLTTGSMAGTVEFGPDSYWSQHSDQPSWVGINLMARIESLEIRL